MDKFEQSDSEKETNDSHNTCYQNAIHYAFARLKECPSNSIQKHMFLGESVVTQIRRYSLFINDNS